jgi:hypothetical protein
MPGKLSAVHSIERTPQAAFSAAQAHTHHTLRAHLPHETAKTPAAAALLPKTAARARPSGSGTKPKNSGPRRRNCPNKQRCVTGEAAARPCQGALSRRQEQPCIRDPQCAAWHTNPPARVPTTTTGLEAHNKTPAGTTTHNAAASEAKVQGGHTHTHIHTHTHTKVRMNGQTGSIWPHAASSRSRGCSCTRPPREQTPDTLLPSANKPRTHCCHQRR